MKVDSETVKDWIGSAFGISVWVIIIWALVHYHNHHVYPNPATEKALEEKAKQEALQAELKYEEKFWANSAANNDPIVIGKIITPNGAVITGKVLFIPRCPKEHWCVEPDGSLYDEYGEDMNNPVEPDSGYSEAE